VRQRPALTGHIQVRSGARRSGAGAWLRRASYPELPGAVAEAESAVDAIDAADDKRVEIIVNRLARGVSVPVPRPPI
jgi:hypothetical protein